MKSIIIFDYLSKASLYLLVVLLPLWFLPITQNTVGYQKQALLVMLVFTGMISWLAKMVYEGGVRFRTSWLHIPVLALLGALALSTFFSEWRYGSFWGWPLHVSDNFLTFLAFVLLYFLISQSVKDGKHLFFLLGGFLLSGTAAVLLALLQMKGVFSFNTLGTSNSVALFGALLLPLAFGMSSVQQKAWKAILLGVSVLLFVSLALLDFSTAWLAMIGGLLALLAFDLWGIRDRSKAQRISLPMVFVVAALFFLMVEGFSIPGAPVKQAEVFPSARGELTVLQGMLSENPLTLLVGSGPGTFVLEHAKFRSLDLNQTILWNTRFSSGASEFFDWFLTKGTTGLFLLLVLIGGGAALGVRKLMEQRKGEDFSYTLGLLGSLIAATIGFALYPANFALWLAFWVLTGSLGFLVSRQTSAVPLSSGSASQQGGPSFFAAASSVVFLTALVAGAGLLIVGGQKYYAEIEYMRGVRASQEDNGEEAIARIANAAKLNPAVDLYWRDLAQLSLRQANEIAANTTLAEDLRQRQTGSAINRAVEASQEATKTAPKNAANWNVQGFLYRNLIGVAGAEDLALKAYQEAQKLEPASPFPWTEMGRVKILSAQAGRENRLQDAITDLQKAVELKPDYAPAHYLLAVAYDQQGNQAEAIAKLEETKLVAPGDVGLAFQLGVIYYRQNELAKARDEFERAKSLNIQYSNARYMLGLVYDRLGRRADALAEFSAVGALNPENQEVKTILANLAAGRAALDGIGEPAQPPIQETPEEIAPEEQ